MKSMSQIYKSCQCLFASALVVGLAAFLAPSSSAYAADGTAKGGAAKLIPLKPIQTVEDAQAVEPGDTVVMSCPKCRNSWMTVAPGPLKAGAAAPEMKVLRHECPGCSAKIVTEGHGKAKTTKVVHVCNNCGSEDAYCCTTKQGAGPTPGMEKK